jgi:hypothetical protein
MHPVNQQTVVCRTDSCSNAARNSASHGYLPNFDPKFTPWSTPPLLLWPLDAAPPQSSNVYSSVMPQRRAESRRTSSASTLLLHASLGLEVADVAKVTAQGLASGQVQASGALLHPTPSLHPHSSMPPPTHSTDGRGRLTPIPLKLWFSLTGAAVLLCGQTKVLSVWLGTFPLLVWLAV